MGFWWGNLRERGHLEVLGIDEIIILKWASKKLDRGVWTGSVRVRIRAGGRLSECSNEPLVFIKCGNFLTS
jgi:hypothetical protein